MTGINHSDASVAFSRELATKVGICNMNIRYGHGNLCIN